MRRIILLLLLVATTGIFAGTVHIFGDSHAWHSFAIRQKPSWPPPKHDKFTFVFERGGLYMGLPIETYFIGGRLMHSGGRDGFKILNVRQSGGRDGDVCVFSLGEVDVRCHIGRQRDEKNGILTKS